MKFVERRLSAVDAVYSKAIATQNGNANSERSCRKWRAEIPSEAAREYTTEKSKN